MKKLLLSLSFVLALGSVYGQNQFAFGFEGTTADLATAGWVTTNQSTPATATLWSIPTTAPTTTFAGGAQGGSATSFALVNFTSVGVLTATGATGSGPISNWLITPVITVQNGDVVSFYTRIGRNGVALYADRLQLRMSTNGGFTANPSTGATDLGDFTNLLIDVNPSLNLTDYPVTWTQESYTVTGLTGSTDVKFAFRYFVNDGGQDGLQSDIIGIDTFSVDRPLATDSFIKNNFSVYPNPANNVININKTKNVAMASAQITDINGRVVKTVNSEVSQINISDLNAGVYMLKIVTAEGTGTTKIIKK